MEIQESNEYDLESIDSFDNSMEDEEEIEEVNTETIDEAENEPMGCQQLMYDTEIYASIEDLDSDVISQVSFLAIEEAYDVSICCVLFCCFLYTLTFCGFCFI